MGRENFINTIESLDDFEESQIYLNCLGEIINGCDWSYENQKFHKICDVKDLKSTVEKLQSLVYS